MNIQQNKKVLSWGSWLQRWNQLVLNHPIVFFPAVLIEKLLWLPAVIVVSLFLSLQYSFTLLGIGAGSNVFLISSSAKGFTDFLILLVLIPALVVTAVASFTAVIACIACAISQTYFAIQYPLIKHDSDDCISLIKSPNELWNILRGGKSSATDFLFKKPRYPAIDSEEVRKVGLVMSETETEVANPSPGNTKPEITADDPTSKPGGP